MDYMHKIREMELMTQQEEQLKKEDIQEYLERQRQRMQDGQNGNVAPEKQQDQAICQRLANMMMEDLDADRELQELLPEAHKKKEEDLKQLRKEASRSGMDKIKNDITGKQRRAAKARLMQIGRKQGEIDSRRHNRPLYIPAERRERERGRHWYNPFRAITNSVGLGTWDQRRGNETYAEVQGTVQEDAWIQTKSGVLVGQFYQPAEEQRRTGKLVIVFSGSGGAGGEMIQPIVPVYTDAGAAVLHASYRGFGVSVSQKNGKNTHTHLCEDGIYEDGRAIYDYAVKELGYRPSDIILHGYSLGGAVAAKVAADIAEENAARQGEGQMVEEKERLGGIVLHSSIATMSEAAEGGIRGLIGRLGSGNFDTRSYMRRLHKYDPNLPVHYRGGFYNLEDDDDDANDHLSLQKTRLDQDDQAKFVNSSSYNGMESHMDDRGVRAANMNAGLDALQLMVTRGRNINMPHY